MCFVSRCFIGSEIYFDRGDDGGENDSQTGRFDALWVDSESRKANRWLSEARTRTPSLTPTPTPDFLTARKSTSLAAEPLKTQWK